MGTGFTLYWYPNRVNTHRVAGPIDIFNDGAAGAVRYCACPVHHRAHGHGIYILREAHDTSTGGGHEHGPAAQIRQTAARARIVIPFRTRRLPYYGTLSEADCNRTST